ncbi:hypothetical protein M513_12360, partial [Trichuris suis]
MAAFHRRRCNVKIDFSEVSDEMTVGLSEPPSSEDEEGEGQEAGNCRAIPIPDEVDGWESPTADTISASPSPPISLAVFMIVFTWALIPSNSWDSLTASLRSLFQHAFTVSDVSSSIASFMNVIASAMVKDFQQSKMLRSGLASMAARILSNTNLVYIALTQRFFTLYNHPLLAINGFASSCVPSLSCFLSMCS